MPGKETASFACMNTLVGHRGGEKLMRKMITSGPNISGHFLQMLANQKGWKHAG